MKNRLILSKFYPPLRLKQRLVYRMAIWGAVVLVCRGAAAQNLFVSSDAAGRNIYEFTPTGVRSTFASGLNGPAGLTFDKAGNLFVADVSANSNGTTSGTIYKFTSGGVRSVFASGLSYPTGLAFDSARNLFVGDRGNIYKFSPQGVRSTFASGLGSSSGLAFDSLGNLFVSANFDAVTQGVAKVYKFTPQGVRTTFASGLTGPWSLAFDSAGNLWVADTGDIDGLGAALYKFTPNGVKHTVASWKQDGFAPEGGVAFDSAGNLFVAAFDPKSGDAIYKFTPGGGRTIFATDGAFGSLAFQPAQIPTATLVNISARGSIEAGEGALISGFIISGTGNKTILLRALGQTLTNFGIIDALQNPTIELHDGTGALIASNDNWKDTQRADITATGLAPPNDLESAILSNLAPGSYTAIVRGKNATTGTALVEAYDVDQIANAHLTNISTRGFVDLNNGVIIGGFIVSQGGSVNVLVRALGPTLTQFGVAGALQDPTLALYNANGTQIASNNNWKDTQQTLIQSSGLAPPDEHESAIEETLTPGNYTIVERDNINATGVGLIEVYTIP